MASKTKQHSLTISERRAKAARLYQLGYSHSQIAEMLDVSDTTVGLDLKYIRDEWQERATRSMDRMKAEHFQRLLDLERECITGLEEARAKNRQGTRFLEIRRRVLVDMSKLFGLNAPEQHHHSSEGGTTVALDLSQVASTDLKMIIEASRAPEPVTIDAEPVEAIEHKEADDDDSL